MAFRIEVQPVNDWITLDGIERKIRLMAGGMGLVVLSLQLIDEQSTQLTDLLDDMERADKQLLDDLLASIQRESDEVNEIIRQLLADVNNETS